MSARRIEAGAPPLEVCVGVVAATMGVTLLMLAGLPRGVVWLGDGEETVLRPVTASLPRPSVIDVPSDWLKDTFAGNGTAGRRHEGAEGQMGSRRSRRDRGVYGLKGPRDEPRPQLARRPAPDDARRAGILGILRGSHVPSVFGADSALGRDAADALGGLVGDRIEDARGAGGFALVGHGPGGRGTGRATVGLTACGGVGQGGG